MQRESRLYSFCWQISIGIRKGNLKVKRKTISVLATLLIIFLLGGAIYQKIATALEMQKYPPPGELVDVNNHKLHVQVVGIGTPTVVMESGEGGTSLDWSFVQTEIGKITTVYTYDRAGFGWSDPSLDPRTCDEIVDDLYVLLENSGAKGPYILVGHSFGGLIVRLFASKYPNEVVGIVLVDAVHEDLYSRFPSELWEANRAQLRYINIGRITAPFGLPRLLSQPVATQNLPPEFQSMADIVGLRTQVYNALYKEVKHFTECADQVLSNPFPPNIPLVVLSRSKPETWPIDLPNEEAEQIWMDLQIELANLSSNSTHIIVEDSGHFIHIDRPETIVDAIQEIMTTMQ